VKKDVYVEVFKFDNVKTKELDVGDIVLVESGARYIPPRQPRSEWPKGKIMEWIVDVDGVVRGARVFLATTHDMVVRKTELLHPVGDMKNGVASGLEPGRWFLKKLDVDVSKDLGVPGSIADVKQPTTIVKKSAEERERV